MINDKILNANVALSPTYIYVTLRRDNYSEVEWDVLCAFLKIKDKTATFINMQCPIESIGMNYYEE